MALPKPNKAKIDSFLSSARADTGRHKNKPDSKYLLAIPEELRQAIRLESIELGYSNMSTYICEILERRQEILEELKMG